MLVVGDANAKGFGTLRKPELVDVTIMAQPGASCRNIGRDIEVTWKHKFHKILTVLSNEVPVFRTRQKTWEQAQGHIKAVLSGLQRFLIIDQPASHVFLSAPFNRDPLLGTKRFLKELRKAAEEAGASFPIEWLPEHSDTEMPHKRLDVAGKQLLADSSWRASRLPQRLSGPS